MLPIHHSKLYSNKPYYRAIRLPVEEDYGVKEVDAT